MSNGAKQHFGPVFNMKFIHEAVRLQNDIEKVSVTLFIRNYLINERSYCYCFYS